MKTQKNKSEIENGRRRLIDALCVFGWLTEACYLNTQADTGYYRINNTPKRLCGVFVQP